MCIWNANVVLKIACCKRGRLWMFLCVFCFKYFMSAVITSIDSFILVLFEYDWAKPFLVHQQCNTIELFKTTWHRDICVTAIKQNSLHPSVLPMAWIFLWNQTNDIQIDWHCSSGLYESIMDTIFYTIDISRIIKKIVLKTSLIMSLLPKLGVFHWIKFPFTFDAISFP